MKFQYVNYWNETLLYLLGWLVFIATIKFVRLLRFNKRYTLYLELIDNLCIGSSGWMISA